MRELAEKQEIWTKVNVEGVTVIRMDLKDKMGRWFGPKVKVVTTKKDGSLKETRKQLYVSSDTKEIVMFDTMFGLSEGISYDEFDELVEYANAPVLHPESEVMIAVIDSRLEAVFPPILVRTDKFGEICREDRKALERYMK